MTTFVTRRAKELGLKVKDAKEPLEIVVTKRDITLATQKNAKCCAYARAAKRTCPGVTAAYFFRSTAYLEYPDRMERYALPPSVQKEIVSFDRAKMMAPGTYQISSPRDSRTLKESRKRSKKQKEKEARLGRGPIGHTKIKRGIVHKTQMIRTLQEPAD